MIAVFADTFYWTALFNQRDAFHLQAREATTRLASIPLVTTESVFAELLATFSAGGPAERREVARSVRRLLTRAQLEVLPQTHELFLAGLDLYERRPDKQYSLVDCISMQVMRERGITEVLTHDHHFAQEGFVLLL